jgi:Invasion associated locus B (IalB) protein
MDIFRTVMIRNARALCIAIVALGALTGAGTAKEPTPLGEFSDWAAYVYKADGGDVCYIVSQPKKMVPSDVKRDPVFFLVTHRSADKVKNEVNTIIGYPFKKDSSAIVDIGGTKFELFTHEDGAWSDSAVHDGQVVEAMKAGVTMVVTGTSSRGTVTSDTYSLSGVTAAMAKIDAACK